MMVFVNNGLENHSLTGFASVEYQYEDYDYTNIRGEFEESLLIENLASIDKGEPEKDMSKSNFMGIVFQAEYGYKGKYYVSGSVRTDGSSRFYKDNRWGKFWSVGASWRISNEACMENANGWFDN